MVFHFNPHKHVKIWISTKPDSFLNFENQNRLIKMRKLNPDDTIHFLYAEDLLEQQAKNELKIFCKKYNISPIAIEKDILPGCNTPKEKQLVQWYQHEIDRLKNQGGNPAAASDILRWIGPVQDLGIYADFDVSISTQGLQKEIEVDAPMLFNLGSVKILSNQINILSFNNDVIAIVDRQKARKKIEQVQDSILNAYTNHLQNFSYNAYHDSCVKELSFLLPQFIIRFLEWLIESFCKAANELNAILSTQTNKQESAWLTPAEIRQQLQGEKNNDQFKFTQRALSVLGLDSESLDEEDYITQAAALYRNYLVSKTGWMSWLFLPSQQYTNLRARLMLNNEDLNHIMIEEAYISLYMQTVIGSTGPTVMMMALFDKNIFDTKTLDNELVPYSMGTYQLDKHFQLDNGLPMNSSALAALSKLASTASPGQIGDLSWIEKGAQLQKNREEKIQNLLENKGLPQLSSEFSQLAQEIHAHIQQIKNQLQGCFGFFQKESKIEKIDALEKILGHIEHNKFGIDNFYRNLHVYRSKKNGSAFNHSKTKALIDRCEALSDQAIAYRVESISLVKKPIDQLSANIVA